MVSAIERFHCILIPNIIYVLHLLPKNLFVFLDFGQVLSFSAFVRNLMSEINGFEIHQSEIFGNECI